MSDEIVENEGFEAVLSEQRGALFYKALREMGHSYSRAYECYAKVLVLRALGFTLKEIANGRGVGAARVHQMEGKANRLLREHKKYGPLLRDLL